MRTSLHLSLLGLSITAASFAVTAFALPVEEQLYPVDLPASCLNTIDDLNAADCCMRTDIDYTWGTAWAKRCCEYNPTFSYCSAVGTGPTKYCCLHGSEQGRAEDYCFRYNDQACDNRQGTPYNSMTECFDQCDEPAVYSNLSATAGTINP